MADVELVIKIPDHLYKLLKDFPSDSNEGNIENVLMKAVEHGTTLPKGHGRLIDADKLKVELEYGIRAGNYEEGYDKYAHINNMDDCVDAVVYADTIIEADKAESEG